MATISSETWALQCAKGREQACLALAKVETTGSPVHLYPAFALLGTEGEQVGFLHEIAQRHLAMASLKAVAPRSPDAADPESCEASGR